MSDTSISGQPLLPAGPGRPVNKHTPHTQKAHWLSHPEDSLDDQNSFNSGTLSSQTFVQEDTLCGNTAKQIFCYSHSL